MNFRIIKTDNIFPDVLLYRDIGEDGLAQKVVISAIGLGGDYVEHFYSETVYFKEKVSSKNFIRNYTTESAHEWCKAVINNI